MVTVFWRLSYSAFSSISLGPSVHNSTFSHWVAPAAMTPLQGDSLTDGFRLYCTWNKPSVHTHKHTDTNAYVYSHQGLLHFRKLNLKKKGGNHIVRLLIINSSNVINLIWWVMESVFWKMNVILMWAWSISRHTWFTWCWSLIGYVMMFADNLTEGSNTAKVYNWVH